MLRRALFPGAASIEMARACCGSVLSRVRFTRPLILVYPSPYFLQCVAHADGFAIIAGALHVSGRGASGPAATLLLGKGAWSLLRVHQMNAMLMPTGLGLCMAQASTPCNAHGMTTLLC